MFSTHRGAESRNNGSWADGKGPAAEESYSLLSFRYIGSSSTDTGSGSGDGILGDAAKQNVQFYFLHKVDKMTADD